MFAHRDATLKEMSVRTVIASAPRKDLASVTIKLVHRSAGWECAGAGTRDACEAWGALYELPSGTTGGQWYLTEADARAHFNRSTGKSGK